MATIYRKTTKGQAEIEHRTLKLAPRFRTVLIMVDGRRSDEEILRLMPPGGGEALAALLGGGLIEPIGVTAPGPLAREAPPPAVPQVATMPPGFDQRRRGAARTITELIGPMGDAVALRVERAATPEALSAALDLAAQVITNTRGQALAAEFRQRFSA